MQERIRALRKSLGLTQTEFGRRVGVKGNTVTGYESGLRNPSDAVLSCICREFRVSEGWLRRGEGEMFPAMGEEEELAAFLGEVSFSEKEDFRRRFFLALSRLSEEEWTVLEKLVDSLSKS